MFLVILESGEIRKAEQVMDEDLDACDDGILDLVNLNNDVPMQYCNGEWHEVETL
jgi:hypothetical protein